MRKQAERFDLCIIGGGAAGLSLAAGAAQLGQRVVLYEAGPMGGDCLNHGCVPSKALIAAGKAAHTHRHSGVFGVTAHEPVIEWTSVLDHVRTVIAGIAPVDSQERFERLGVKVIREWARFRDPKTVESASGLVRAKRFVIATGSRPIIPSLTGVEETPYLTNETIFQIPHPPKHLLILGGGPIGVELGQAFRRLGARVSIFESDRILGRMDPECANIVVNGLKQEGVEIHERTRGLSIKRSADGGVELLAISDGNEVSHHGSEILFAIGRRPDHEGLNLPAAGVKTNDRGHIVSDPYLRTTNATIYVAGDAAGRQAMTHVAGWHASALVRTLLFRARTRVDSVAAPQAVYCDPEIAQIGLGEAEAKSKFGARVSSTEWRFEENDRARAERKHEGMAKIIVGPRGRILGACIVGEGAADLIQIIGLAMVNKLSVRALTAQIAPYPTRGEIVKRAAGQYYTSILFSKNTQRLVKLLGVLP